MLFFNSGLLFVNPVAGNQATNPTPIHVGILQDISLNVDQATKELWGEYNFPADVAFGRTKVTGKFTFGELDVNLFNQAMFGLSTTAGIQLMNSESHSVPASSPYTVTVTNSAQFATDLGVQYQTGGNFQKVASVTAAGQYSVAAGVYTFDLADAGKAVQIAYTSTAATSGNTLTVTQQLMGYGPVAELFLENSYQAPGNGFHIFAARLNKLNMPLKLEDYTKAEIDFEAYANSAGKVFEIYQVSV